jgi:hypothetical protein
MVRSRHYSRTKPFLNVAARHAVRLLMAPETQRILAEPFSTYPRGKEKGLTANREALSFIALGRAGQI